MKQNNDEEKLSGVFIPLSVIIGISLTFLIIIILFSFRVNSLQTDFVIINNQQKIILNNFDTLSNISMQNNDLIDILNSEVSFINLQIQRQEGIIGNIQDERIKNWFKKSKLENYDWSKSIGCEPSFNNYNKFIIRRIYDDIMLIDGYTLGVNTPTLTMYYWNTTEVECFDLGLSVKCKELLC